MERAEVGRRSNENALRPVGAHMKRLLFASSLSRPGWLLSHHVLPRQRRASARDDLCDRDDDGRGSGPGNGATPVDVGAGWVVRRVFARHIPPRRNYHALRDRSGCRTPAAAKSTHCCRLASVIMTSFW